MVEETAVRDLASHELDPSQRLTRSSTDKYIGGVSGGLGQHFGVDATLVRVGWIFATLVSGGAALVAYAALLVVVPRDDDAPQTEDRPARCPCLKPLERRIGDPAERRAEILAKSSPASPLASPACRAHSTTPARRPRGVRSRWCRYTTQSDPRPLRGNDRFVPGAPPHGRPPPHLPP